MFGKFGATELILILCIALVIFGPSKLPQMGKAMGQTIKEFRKGCNEMTKGVQDPLKDAEKDATSDAKKEEKAE